MSLKGKAHMCSHLIPENNCMMLRGDYYQLQGIHHTIISHPCNHLENIFLVLSFTRKLHKIWPNLSPLTEYWPFQIPIYETRDFEFWKTSKKKHGVSMLFPKVRLARPCHRTLSSYSVGKCFISFSSDIGTLGIYVTWKTLLTCKTNCSEQKVFRSQ